MKGTDFFLDYILWDRITCFRHNSIHRIPVFVFWQVFFLEMVQGDHGKKMPLNWMRSISRGACCTIYFSVKSLKSLKYNPLEATQLAGLKYSHLFFLLSLWMSVSFFPQAAEKGLLDLMWYLNFSFFIRPLNLDWGWRYLEKMTKAASCFKLGPIGATVMSCL